MRAELSSWNNGAGIELKTWIGCEGRFALAVGYSAIFWPEFVEFDGYVLRKGFSETSLRGFEQWGGSTRESVEKTMNHLNIADIQHFECDDISRDKLVFLGNLLKEIYDVKLRWQFPHLRCRVEFFVPTDEDDLESYQLSFWQEAHQPDKGQSAIDSD